jgi:prepilin-type processing-associated H-X9-DG protein/prepilin-type N-terminal cleavage/methylation domain-containing protein
MQQTRDQKPCGGFTLVELLVVIGIIAVLLALLVPAVQRVRDTAARTECVNNLKQIGLALQGYHGIYSSFPPGYHSGYDDEGTDTGPGWGWAAFILPHIEQQSVFKAIQFEQEIEAPANASVRVQQIQAYLCPADSVPATWTTMNFDSIGNPIAPICDVASANYIGVFGVSEPGVEGEGIFYRGSSTRIADITDGTSQTMIVGERSFRWCQATWVGSVTGASMVPPPGSPALAGEWNGSGFVLGHTFEGSGGPGSPGTEANGFSSQHSAGANFLFADGHVQFLQTTMNHEVYMALSTRGGDEPVGGDF